MSGKKIQVVNSNGSYAGTLYHKERFTYSFDLRTINGKSHKKIWFLNSHCSYVILYILNSAPIKNWDEYLFKIPVYNVYCFKIDRPTKLYYSNGRYAKTVPAGSYCRLANRCQTGDKYKHLGLLEWWLPDLNNVSYSNYRDYFIDTGVSKNSENTAVYGDWN